MSSMSFECALESDSSIYLPASSNYHCLFTSMSFMSFECALESDSSIYLHASSNYHCLFTSMRFMSFECALESDSSIYLHASSNYHCLFTAFKVSATFRCRNVHVEKLSQKEKCAKFCAFGVDQLSRMDPT